MEQQGRSYLELRTSGTDTRLQYRTLLVGFWGFVTGCGPEVLAREDWALASLECADFPYFKGQMGAGGRNLLSAEVNADLKFGGRGHRRLPSFAEAVKAW